VDIPLLNILFLPVEPVGESESLQVMDWKMIPEAHHCCDQSRLSRKVGGYSLCQYLWWVVACHMI